MIVFISAYSFSPSSFHNKVEELSLYPQPHSNIDGIAFVCFPHGLCDIHMYTGMVGKCLISGCHTADEQSDVNKIQLTKF